MVRILFGIFLILHGLVHSGLAAALDWLRSQVQIQPKKVFVLGHSEGAGIAVRLAGTGAEIAGILLLGGWDRNGEKMLLWQAEQVLPGMKGINKWLIKLLHIDIRKSQLKQFDKIKRSTKDWYRQLHVKINAKWMREFMNYTPAEDLERMQVPVLALTGTKDIQTVLKTPKKKKNLALASFGNKKATALVYL